MNVLISFQAGKLTSLRRFDFFLSDILTAAGDFLLTFASAGRVMLMYVYELQV